MGSTDWNVSIADIHPATMGSTDWNVSIADIHPATIHLLLADTDTHYAATETSWNGCSIKAIFKTDASNNSHLLVLLEAEA